MGQLFSTILFLWDESFPLAYKQTSHSELVEITGLFIVMHLSMLCRREGEGEDCMGWGFDWFCSPRRGDIWIFLRPTWRYLSSDLDEKDWDRTFPRFTHAPYGLERLGNHGSQREQAKAERISLFCLQISFVLARFWSIEPLKILWYQSKRK